MSDRIQYLDLPGIFGAIQQIQGGQQRNRLLDLQMQEAQRKLELEKTQGTTLSTLFGGVDPATGINWSGGRPGLTPTEQNNMIASAFPKEFAEAKIKQLYPTPEKPFAVGNNVYDPQAKTFTQGPSNFSVAPLPGQAAPGDSLRTAAPPQPGPGPTPQRPTIATGPGKTVEGEVPAIYAPHIADAAAVYGVDATVLGNMLLTETAPGGKMTSPKGARGVGQFMPGTAQQYNVDVNDPKSSIDGMGKMMQYLLQKYKGDYRLAVGAYNWGEGNVDQWIKPKDQGGGGGDPSLVPKETMEYVRKTVGLQTAGPNDQTGFDHPGTAKPGNSPGQQPAAPQYPPGMVGFRTDDKTGEFVSGGKPGYGIGVDAQGKPVGTAPLPGMQAEVGGEFGNTPEARAIQVLVDSGKMTRQQAAEWLAGKQVIGPNGQVDFRTPTGTQQVRPAQLSQGEKDAILESDKAVEAGNASIGALTKALKLNDEAFSGATAEARAWADRNVLPGEWGGTATTELQNLISTQALNSLRAIFGGNPTEGERKILLDLQASVNKSPGERKIILDNALAGAKARVEREQQRGQSMRSGTYFTQGLPQQTPGGGSGGAPDPNNPQVGDRARNSQTGAMIEWNGSAWVAVQ